MGKSINMIFATIGVFTVAVLVGKASRDDEIKELKEEHERLLDENKKLQTIVGVYETLAVDKLKL